MESIEVSMMVVNTITHGLRAQSKKNMSNQSGEITVK